MRFQNQTKQKRAQALLVAKLLDLEARGGPSLARLVDAPEVERVAAAGGGIFEIASTAFWDVEPGDSDLYVEVAVSPSGSIFRRSRKSGLVVDPYTGEPVRYSDFPES